MKALYRRIKGRNYILFYEIGEGGAQTEMIRRNRIPGLAAFYEEWEDGRWYCGYDVTGAQPLSRLLEFRDLEKEETEAFIVRLAEFLQRLEPFLLEWKGVVLDPEYLYCRQDAGHGLFFFCEGQEGSFEDHMKALLMWLLGKTGNEKEALERLLLRLYRSCMEEPLVPEKLFACLDAPEPPPARLPEAEAFDLREEAGREGGVWNRIRRLFRKKPVEMWDDLEPQREEEAAAPAEKRETSREYPQPFQGGPETDTELFLAEEDSEDLPFLFCQERKEKIVLTEFPFFIGCRKGVHYDPGERGVSRLHLRLDCRNGRYWVMDLNSTNGSRLNGKELAPNEERELVHGDSIGIVGQVYEFRVFDRRGES